MSGGLPNDGGILTASPELLIIGDETGAATGEGAAWMLARRDRLPINLIKGTLAVAHLIGEE